MKVLIYGVDSCKHHCVIQAFEQDRNIDPIYFGSMESAHLSYIDIEKNRGLALNNCEYEYSLLENDFLDFWHAVDRNSDIGVRYTLVRRLFREYICSWELAYREYQWDCVLFLTAPHLQWCVGLNSLLKLKGIKSYILNTTIKAEYKFISQNNANNTELKIKTTNGKNDKRCEELIILATKRKYEYMVKQGDTKIRNLKILLIQCVPIHFLMVIGCIFERFAKRNLFKYKKSLSFKFSWEGMFLRNDKDYFNELKNKIRRIKKLKKEYEKYSIGVESNKIGEFVFLPLHYQPEATSYPANRNLSDQIDFAYKIADVLDKYNIKLIVKEHSSTFFVGLRGDRGRDLLYYNSLSKHKNIILSRLGDNSNELISSSKAVVTINGTASAEKAAKGGIGIAFFPSWAMVFNTFHVCQNFDDFDKIIRGGVVKYENIDERQVPYIIDIEDLADCKYLAYLMKMGI
jgi:hypothetical protein